MGVVNRCTIGVASEELVGTVFGHMLFDFIAIEAVDQLGSGFERDLGGADPAGECFKPLLENSLHRVGIRQQDLEHPRPIRDFGQLVDLYARFELLNLGLYLRFRVFPYENSIWWTKTVFWARRSGGERVVRYILDRARMEADFSFSGGFQLDVFEGLSISFIP